MNGTRRLRVGLAALFTVSGFWGLMIARPGQAFANTSEETYGWLYKSSDSDCAYYRDSWVSPASGGGWQTETDAYLAYTYFGLYTVSCATEWNRPAGNIVDAASWYEDLDGNPSQAVECMYSNYYANTTTASGFLVTWDDGTVSQYCSAYVWEGSANFEYNGAWHGGYVYPGAWDY